MKTIQDLQARLTAGVSYWIVAGEFKAPTPEVQRGFDEFVASLPQRIEVTRVENGKVYGADEEDREDGIDEPIIDFNDHMVEKVWRVIDENTFQLGGLKIGNTTLPLLTFSFIDPTIAKSE